MKTKLQAVYLDWVNNYLTVERFADDCGLTVDQAKLLIELGRSVHESEVERICHDMIGNDNHTGPANSSQESSLSEHRYLPRSKQR